MIRVESYGSIWEIDLDLMRYRRWPKHEAPRDRPEWSDARAGALQDFVWHGFCEKPFVTRTTNLPRIVIPVSGERRSFFGRRKLVSAPLESDEATRVEALLS